MFTRYSESKREEIAQNKRTSGMGERRKENKNTYMYI